MTFKLKYSSLGLQIRM